MAAASQSGSGRTDPTDPTTPAAPVASDVQPLALACQCLNLTLAADAENTLVTRILSTNAESSKESEPQPFGPKRERVKVWLPPDAETVKHGLLVTFEADGDKAAWRKCWVCNVDVYRAVGKAAGDIAPVDGWVDVELGNGVLYGAALEEAQQRTPLPYSGLVLDAPTDSAFGRPPRSSTPQPYPAVAKEPNALLPPISDPFFLPPPFIPSHPALRDMCNRAVDALQVKRDEIEREIREYITQRTHDMRRLEDQVRAEVETLWDRFADGPGRGELREFMDQRRASVSNTAKRVHSPVRERNSQSFDRPRQHHHQVPYTDLTQISGVTASPPKISGQFNHNTAIAAGTAATSSLLSASLSANAFFAPPPRVGPVDDDKIEAITKTASHDGGLDREVAMSYAFSAMEDSAIATGRRRKSLEKKETKEAEKVETAAEDGEKGIDSWIAIERADMRKRVEQAEKQEAAPAAAVNGVTESKEKKTRVTFQEPDKKNKVLAAAEAGDDDVVVAEDDDDYVFDMEGDTPPAPVEQPPVVAPQRLRTMVEDNLSQTFAADVPSHRAAWRTVEGKGLEAVLRRDTRKDEADDDDVDDHTPTESTGLARSVPIHIVKPMRKRKTELERKTSLTDREGHLVPGLIGAMRERGVGPSAPRDIAGSVVPTRTMARRGSRSVSGDREREAVKSYAADPGAVFESLAEGTVDSDEDDEDDGTPAELPNGAKFVPPHVLAQRAVKGEVGWRSLAS